MLAGEEDPCKMLGGFGNRRQLVDPAGDLVAEGRVLWRRDCLLHLAHAFPMTKPRRSKRAARPIDTNPVPADGRIRTSPNEKTGASLSLLDQPANDRIRRSGSTFAGANPG